MIGVCIKYFHENYGGMLQAYATTAILEEKGLNYELIRYKKKLTPMGIVRSLPRLLNRVLLNDKYEAFLKKQGLRAHPEFSQNDKIRMAQFEKFKEEHFTKLSPVLEGYEALCEGARRYSAVITGSDQLWSPAGLPTNFYNLMFVPEDIRKISYASSFGVKTIPWYQKTRTAAYLNRLDHISMRENRGAEIVQELTGKKVLTVLDPVLMFDKSGWEKMVPVQKEIEEPYLFAYFLGKNPEYREAVKQAAEKLGCKVVALRHLDQYVPEDENFGDFAPYDVSPDRFLNFLRGAEYVCTDSFHGFCFSIIHGKQVIVFNRYSNASKVSKNSRIDTLCQMFGLQERRYCRHMALDEQLRKEIDYPKVQGIVNERKTEAYRYLQEALSDAE